MHRLLRRWKDLSIAKKLYLVVGVMGTLIAAELLILQFAMNTLSAARAFVGGESLWSKSQKDAFFSLQRYAATLEEKDYQAFLAYLKVPDGDHLARIELAKPFPDMAVVTAGFRQGGVHPDDIPKMIKLLQRFHRVSYISRAIEYWTAADSVLDQMKETAAQYRTTLAQQGYSRTRATEFLNELRRLNADITPLEEQFSYELGEGSRFLENTVLTLLLLAVIMVETVGLTATFLTSRSLSQGLREVIIAANRMGKGDFHTQIAVQSADEVGELAQAINKMAALLETSYRELEDRVAKRTIDLTMLATENARLYEETKTALKTRDVFLSVASHELRTPFTSLSIQLQMLTRQLKKHPELGAHSSLLELASGAVDQARRYGALLDQLLDLTRLRVGHFKLQREPVNLCSIARDAVSQFQFDSTGRPAVIDLVLRSEACGRFDRTRIGQVATNLVANALKYGKGKPVEVGVWAEDGRGYLYVKDHGAGIPAEQKKRIFERFERANGDPTISGLGLGLYISKQIVDAHGGTIDVSTPPEGGSVFTVCLDLDQQEVWV